MYYMRNSSLSRHHRVIILNNCISFQWLGRKAVCVLRKIDLHYYLFMSFKRIIIFDGQLLSQDFYMGARVFP